MSARCIFFLILASVALGCQPKKSNHGSGAAGGGQPGGGGAPTSFKTFMAEQKTECAGFKRSMTKLSAIVNVNDQASFRMSMQLVENGSYTVTVLEDSDVKGRSRYSATGTWTEEGGKIKLSGEAAAELEARPDASIAHVQVRGFTSPKATLSYPAHFSLVPKREEDDLRIGACAAGTHEDMRQQGAEILIAGKPALNFWSEQLLFSEDERPNRDANVGENLDLRFSLKAHSNKTFTLEVRRNFEKLAEVGGAWQLRDGLIVLGDIGVLIPFREQGKYLVPQLFLVKDIVNKRDVIGIATRVVLNGRGH
ncbi:MAG: hypothetical protein AB7F86_08115 [Bdellovibrionales bacterium]